MMEPNQANAGFSLEWLGENILLITLRQSNWNIYYEAMELAFKQTQNVVERVDFILDVRSIRMPDNPLIHFRNMGKRWAMYPQVKTTSVLMIAPHFARTVVEIVIKSVFPMYAGRVRYFNTPQEAVDWIRQHRRLPFTR